MYSLPHSLPDVSTSYSGKSLFPNICGLPLLLFFWLKWAGYLDKPFWRVKPNARRLKHIACDHAHSFTHQKGFSYQIFELEESALPQQGILPISARKTTTKANHRCLEKDSFHCERVRGCDGVFAGGKGREECFPSEESPSNK